MSHVVAPPPSLPACLGPRVAALVAWLLAHQDEIEAIDNGQLVVDWGGPSLKARLTRVASIPLPPPADG